MQTCTVYLLVVVFATFVSSAPLDSLKPQEYLTKFGYLDREIVGDATDEIMKDALKDFQSSAGLEITGTFDEATARKMKMPRCGFHDRSSASGRSSSVNLHSSHSFSRMVKRFVQYGTRWNKKHITYAITKYATGVKSRVVDDEAAAAFKYWEDVTPLTFQQIVKGADITIRFEKGEHGDDSPFDGPRGILGHSYKPRHGVSHFDDEEKWTNGDHAYDGANLKQVMTHEIGHALGLDHSRSSSAVMAPFYNGYDPYFALGADDVDGIQSIYGAGGPNPNPKPRRTTTSTEAPDPGTGTMATTTTTEKPSVTTGEICENPTFDAMSFDGHLGIRGFRGKHYYSLSYQTMNPKPKNISDDFGVNVQDLDAALQVGHKTLMFKGDRVWASQGGKSVSGYPKPISQVYPDVPANVSAAFTFENNLYFVKYNVYYKTALAEMSARAKIVPCPFKFDSHGGPSHVEAGFEWPGYATFLFVGKNYYNKIKGQDTLTEKIATSSYFVRCK